MSDPLLVTRCMICREFYPGEGARGICPACDRRYPVFVPRAQLRETGDLYMGSGGYVFRSTGAVRYDHSASAIVKGDKANVGWRAPMQQVFPHQPLRKRTRAERVDSLHRRFAESCKQGVLGASIIRDVQREQIADGQNPMTDEQIRQLAQVFMDRAEKEVNEVEGRSVTRSR